MQKHARRVQSVSFAVIAGSVLLLMRALPLGQLRDGLESWMDGLGVIGPVVFGLIYAAATVLFLPGSVLTLAAGAIFGLWVGFLTVSVGSNVGAALAFLIARYAARRKVEQVAASRPGFKAIDEAISEGGWKIVAMLRLSPAIPFNVQNYLYGLTDIRFWTCVLTSWVAMIPGTFMFVYLGHIAGEAAAGDRERRPEEWALLIVGLLATIAVTVYITKLAKQKLDERTAGNEQPAERVDTTPESEKPIRPTRVFGVASLAAVLLALAVFAQFNPDALARSLRRIVGAGPPAVDSGETYVNFAGTATFDHSRFDQVLRDHVVEGGWVDYERLADDSSQLDAYLEELAAAPLDQLGRDDRLALLINAYNAFTLRLILDYYPLGSVKDIPSVDRWEAIRWNVGGHVWSLNQIEHEQIRPHFVEPRIHFVLVCAASGCPPLISEAYSADNLERQLQRQAEFVHDHVTWFYFDETTATVYLTQLYDWYAEDFEQSDGAETNLDYAAAYSSNLEDRLQRGESVSVRYLDYEWSLNSVQNQQAR